MLLARLVTRVLFSFGLVLFVNHSASALEGNIYVVDIQRVVSGSVAGKAARSNIEEEGAKRSKKLEQMGKELEREQQSLVKQASLLSQSALEEKQNAFREKEKGFKRSVNDQKEELASIQRRELSMVIEEIQKVAPLTKKASGPKPN